MLVYKFNYDFNPRCPLLTLLFQYTQKYAFLHQKLIDVVHQDIDQQQGGNGFGGSMSVSNSFVVYQLHWESKQLRLTKKEEKKLKEQIRFAELYTKFEALKESIDIKAKQKGSTSLANISKSAELI